MVSNEEIKRMLESRRRGVDIKKEEIKSENYKICPHCKTKNPEKALFCVNCGRKLDKNLMVKCPSCSTENSKDAKFCVGCGETLKKESPENISEEAGIGTEESELNNSKTSTPEIESPQSVNESVPETIEPKEPELKTPEKSLPAANVPSTVPEHDIINKTGIKKTCPSCKGRNLKNAKFCVVCGEKFDEKSAGQTTVETEEMAEPVPTSTINKGVEETTANRDEPVEEEKRSLMDRVSASEQVPDTETPSAEIKVPNSIIELKNKNKTEEELEEQKSDESLVKSEANTRDEITQKVDPVEKIKKAKELLDIGAITTEEFESIKKKYLQQI